MVKTILQGGPVQWGWITTGERFYNVEMAATLMTAALPLLVYLVSGRLFVRGIAAGALKG